MMQQLVLSANQTDLIDETVDETVLAAPRASSLLDEETLMAMPLSEAKALVAAAFERKYLIRVMERVAGSVSAGARETGLDRTNFRRLLQRHGLR